MFKKYYLAYGSNLNLEQMKYRCPTAKPIGKMNLKDYRLVYKGLADNFAYLTIEKSKGSVVPLGLFEVSYFDILSLDDYEGYPNSYSKFYIPIQVEGKNKKALIYIMNKSYNYHIPSKKYVATCLQGYNDFDFDINILNPALYDTTDNFPKKLTKKINPNSWDLLSSQILKLWDSSVNIAYILSYKYNFVRFDKIGNSVFKVWRFENIIQDRYKVA